MTDNQYIDPESDDWKQGPVVAFELVRDGLSTDSVEWTGMTETGKPLSSLSPALAYAIAYAGASVEFRTSCIQSLVAWCGTLLRALTKLDPYGDATPEELLDRIVEQYGQRPDEAD